MKTILDMDFWGLWGSTPFDEQTLLPVRSINRIPQGAKTVISVLFPYFHEKAIGGNLSIYCAVPDYHLIVKAKLESTCAKLEKEYPNEQFASFVDSAPVPEVRCAAQAGLGAIGKNGLLITKKYGSYVFLGEIVTTMATAGATHPVKPCLQCGLCEKYCPTKAINQSGEIKEERCVSTITQKKGVLTKAEEKAVVESGKVFGCDICQTICPMNQNVSAGLPEFEEDIIHTVEKETVKKLYKNRAFGWRGVSVLERNLKLINTKK